MIPTTTRVPLLGATLLLEGDYLDVVARRVKHERAIVVGGVLRPEPRRSIVLGAGLDGLGVEGVDLGTGCRRRSAIISVGPVSPHMACITTQQWAATRKKKTLTAGKRHVRGGVGLLGLPHDPEVGVDPVVGAEADGGAEPHGLLVAQRREGGQVEGDDLVEVGLEDREADVVEDHVGRDAGFLG